MGPSNATAAESRHMARVKESGCILCRSLGLWDWTADHMRTTVYHHVVEGSKRLGHHFGFGLCDPHHSPYIVGGLHNNLARWEAEHGPQHEWVRSQYRILGIEPPAEVRQWLQMKRAMEAPV